MNLVIDYFTSSNQQRRNEYISTLVGNLNNKHITGISALIADGSLIPLESFKLDGHYKDGGRITFDDIFNFCNSIFPNQICIIANSDIIFDETLKELNNVNLENVFIALTRSEITDNGLKVSTSYVSQDAWIFKTPIKISEGLNFHIGDHGSDNRLARIMLDAGYEIRNPAHKIRVIHNHFSTYRSIDEKSVVPGPYVAIIPNGDINKKADCILFNEFLLV